MPVKTVTIQVTALTDTANRNIAATGAYFEKLRKANPVELSVKFDRLQAIAEAKILAKELAQTVSDTVKVKADTSSFTKGLDSLKGKGGPWWLGAGLVSLPAIATLAGVATGAVIGLGGAFIAGGAALAGFGAVAKPVLSAALTAQQKVNTAQNTYQAALAAGVKPAAAWKAEQLAIGKAYADLSPAQIKLSKQLGNMAQAWQNVKASFTPVIAGSLQPWLAGITTVIGNLGSVIKPMVPVVTALGTEFGILVGSPAFQAFARWVGSTGSAVVSSAGTAILNLVTGIITLLPRFTPLITGAADAISKWSLSFALWAGSQKGADQIKGFLAWFRTNGPVVRDLLKNIGGALKTLAPGLTAGGITELKVISDFFGLIARLPKGIAAPLAETAGALLLMNKLGVVKIGFQILGLGGEAGAAAGGAAATGLWAKALPGVRLIGGALIADVAIHLAASAAPPASQPDVKRVLGEKKKDPGAFNFIQFFFGGSTVNVQAWLEDHIYSPMRTGFHKIGQFFTSWGRDVNKQWTGMWHDTTTIWDAGWNNTVGRTNRGIDAVMLWIGGLPGKIMNVFRAAGTWLVQAGKNAIQGLLNGMESAAGSVLTWIGHFLGNLLPGWAKSLLGIHSPSGVFYDIGRNIVLGLEKGISSHAHLAQMAIGNLAQTAIGALGGGNAANAALAQRMFPQWGSGQQWGAWNYLAMRESGWNQFARNPSSGAYGIAQALPESKYPFAVTAAGGSNPAVQIAWMASYISQRYGDPIRAAQHEAALNWYGGGLNAIARAPTLIGVGERGPELVSVTPLGGGRGGGRADRAEGRLATKVADWPAFVDAVTTTS